jgi:hypothetical protein
MYFELQRISRSMTRIHGSDCYKLDSSELSLAITRQGGHMAPVIFRFPSGDFSPYALAPWQPAEIEPSLPVLLKELRGDFFCLPFGPQASGPPHGDTANAPWECISITEHEIVLQCSSASPQATVKKHIALRDGHHALYITHVISGLDGNFSYGNHPILDFSSMAESQGRVALSPYRWASVYPGAFANPDAGEHGILKSGANFSSISSVPLADGDTIDLSKYPTPAGHEDLVMMVSEPATPEQPFAWSAVTLGDFVWFSLKLQKDFPATLFWISNGGRSAHPWENRHTSRLGIEEVCSYFCDSVDDSRLDKLAALGVPTTRRFEPETPVHLRLIQAAAAVPKDFGQVKHIRPAAAGVEIHGENGHTVTVAIDLSFLITI